jgi:hypothetical protein
LSLIHDPVFTLSIVYFAIDVVYVAQQAAVNKEHGIETAEPKKKKRKSDVMEVEAAEVSSGCTGGVVVVVALVSAHTRG